MRTLVAFTLGLIATAAFGAPPTPPGVEAHALPQNAYLTVTTSTPELAGYGARARNPIRRPWYARLLADAQAKKFSKEAHGDNAKFGGTTDIAFKVAPDGKITGVSITSGSGSKALDEAAIAAMKEVTLPALPEGSNAAPQAMLATFKVDKATEAELIKYLEMLKGKNLF